MADARRSRMTAAQEGIDNHVVSRNVLQHLKQESHDSRPMRLPSAKLQSHKSEDLDVLGSLARRLTLVERELKDKAVLVHKLQQENDALKAAAKSAATRPEPHHSSHQPDASEELRSENTHLHSETARLRRQLRHAWDQVAKMKQFLSDYGMVWVGDPDGHGEEGAQHAGHAAQDPPQPTSSEQHPRSRQHAAYGSAEASSNAVPGLSAGSAPGHPLGHALSSALPASSQLDSRRSEPLTIASKLGNRDSSVSRTRLPFSIERLLQAVEELNQMAGDGEGQLVGDGVAGSPALLRAPEPIRLVLYSDGLQLYRGSPVAYGEPLAAAILRDILDGYFPSCLKDSFPDGVPIKVVDRSTERCLAPGTTSPSRSRGAQNVRTFNDLEEDCDGPGISESRTRLPQMVIRNGQVVTTHGLGRTPGQRVALVSTPADVLLTTAQRNHVGPSLPPPSREGPPVAASAAGSAQQEGGLQLPAIAPRSNPEITSLQVKSEDGRLTFLLKLQYDDTIASLRKCIDSYRIQAAKDEGRPDPAGSYEIRSTFPARVFKDAKETLRDAGLVPNATLFLRSTAPR